MSAYRILLVEDDIWLAELYKDILETEESCEVLHASNAEEALNLLDENDDVRLIILDMILAHHNGIEFLHEVASHSDLNVLPVIVLSSVYKHDFAMSDQRWGQYGVKEYLYKPITKPADLIAAVKKQLARSFVAV